MVPAALYAANLELAEQIESLPGAIVECGVWRGGMIAGLAEVLGPERDYYLYDSFQGLPPAQAVDGPQATAWQQDKTSPFYFDNCNATQAEAVATLARSPARHVHITPGWFHETVSSFPQTQSIALLRLDGDWYESTMVCLEHLFPRVAAGGLIIIDDYLTWEGCARAVHDYLSRTQSTARVREHPANQSYIIKT